MATREIQLEDSSLRLLFNDVETANIRVVFKDFSEEIRVHSKVLFYHCDVSAHYTKRLNLVVLPGRLMIRQVIKLIYGLSVTCTDDNFAKTLIELLRAADYLRTTIVHKQLEQILLFYKPKIVDPVDYLRCLNYAVVHNEEIVQWLLESMPDNIDKHLRYATENRAVEKIIENKVHTPVEKFELYVRYYHADDLAEKLAAIDYLSMTNSELARILDIASAKDIRGITLLLKNIIKHRGDEMQPPAKKIKQDN